MCVCVCMHVWCVYGCVCVRIPYVCMRVCACVCVYMHVCMYVSVHAYIVCMCGGGDGAGILNTSAWKRICIVNTCTVCAP